MMSESENRDTDYAEQKPNALWAFVTGIPRALWAFITGIPRALWRWWTLENCRAAADLLVKFATIVGVIVVANFFVLRPEIAWEESYHLLIDENHVEELYRGEETVPPSVVHQVIQRSNSIAIQQLPKFLPSLGTASTAKLFPESLPEDIEGVLRDIYEAEVWEKALVWDDVWGPFIPRYALDLATSGELSAYELESALNAIEKSMYILARVIVCNNGPVVARGVIVAPPEGFTRSDRDPGFFDLPAGARRTVMFRTDCGDVRIDPDSYSFSQEFLSIGSRFLVWWKPSEVLDRKVLVIIAGLFLSFSLATVLREVYWPLPKEKETGREGD